MGIVKYLNNTQYRKRKGELKLNIFQKKINKQAKLFMIFYNNFWNENDLSFYNSRILTRRWNKEDSINSIRLINNDISKIKEAILENN